MTGLHYQRGPNDRPADVDRWQRLEHRVSAVCYLPALALILVAAAILILGIFLGRGPVTAVVMMAGLFVLVLGVIASLFTAVFAWSASRYSGGVLGRDRLRAAVNLIIVAAMLFACYCALIR